MTDTAYPPLESMVRELWDRQQIADVMLSFGRALDTHDWSRYATTLTDPFDVDFYDLTGLPAGRTTPELWARFAENALGPLVVLHRYTNFHIDLAPDGDPDHAHAIVYHVSRHRKPNKSGDDHYTQYGWYDNDLVRTPEGWRINRLKHQFQWADGNPNLIDGSDPDFQKMAGEIFGTDPQ
ncbi:nuclear transport factor 2 family protein [Tsukamurella spumae]|uniref:Nuclear transport factor 2 family protein n=1 Tax=Tsukamurella spumae TaxID=44753 RepID=A0A846X2P1_9ACTN|nr:nuclear transport factor 2 family protein [Tsukamurella spumae]NKY19778.1 nuclear transport factor 2 family protein [Tsukamurella spumae]